MKSVDLFSSPINESKDYLIYCKLVFYPLPSGNGFPGVERCISFWKSAPDKPNVALPFIWDSS